MTDTTAPAIKTSWIGKSGNYYRLYSPLTWSEAKNFAASEGGYLVKVDSAEENAEIYSRIGAVWGSTEANNSRSLDGGSASYVWLGASDELNEGSWKWVRDGTTLSTARSEWGAGGGIKEPDGSTYQNYLAMGMEAWPWVGLNAGFVIGTAGKWNDIAGTSRLNFVVEWDNPSVQFTTPAGSASEGNSGNTTVKIEAVLSTISAQTVTVPVTYSGTATSGTDYTNATTSITIPAGQTTGTATFSVVGDTTPELDETVIVTMGTPTNATLGTSTVYTHSIVNDDGAVSPYSIKSDKATIDEGSNATFSVVAPGMAAGTALRYTVSGVVATDLVNRSLTGNVSIGANGSGQISIPVLADNVTDGKKTLTVTLDGSAASASVEITDSSVYAKEVKDPSTGHYYSFISDGFSLNSAIDAAAKLSFRGLYASVLRIDNANEQAFVTEEVIPRWGWNGGWLGITYDATQLKWVNVAGDSLRSEASYFNWRGSAPSTQSAISAPFAMITDDGTWLNHNWSGSQYVAEYGQYSAAYSITPSATSATEGSSVTFTIDTKNVEWGTNIAYSLTGISQSDLASGSLTGTAVVNQQGVDGRATVTVALAADNVVEAPESLKLMVGSTTSAPVTVLDLPRVAGPTIQFTTTAGSASEGNSGNTTVKIEAVLSTISAQTVTVPVTYSGTATSGTDYTNATTSITIPAGQTTGTATFSVVGDTTPELDETVIVTMGTPTNATLGTSTVYTHSIVNDDGAVSPYSIKSDKATIDEGSNATFSVVAPGMAAGTALRYTVSGVVATDLVNRSLTGNVSIGANGSGQISIPVLADNVTDGKKTLTVTLDGSAASASVEITDSSVYAKEVKDPSTGHYYSFISDGFSLNSAIDAAAKLSFRGLYASVLRIDNANEQAFVTEEVIPRWGWNGGWLGITYDATQLKWVNVAGDSLRSEASYFNWRGSAPSTQSAISAPFAMITDDGTWLNHNWSGSQYVAEYGQYSAAYSITPSATSATEGSSVTFTIDTKNVEWGTNIAYSLTGISQSDLASGSLTGTAVVNQQGVDGRATVTVALAADNVVEAPESLKLMVGSTTSAPVTVLDLPRVAGPTIQFTTTAGSASEGNSGNTTVKIEAVLSTISAQTVTVPVTYSGTATSGTDYTNATTSITIPAGQTTGTATFSVVGDTTPELDETVIVTMGTPTNATLGTNKVYTHTVLNDDLDQQIVSRTNALTVLVDKGILESNPVLLNDLVEEITTTGTAVTSHTVSYQGTKFKYGDIDALITTVIRDGDFTEEFRKEIADAYPSYGGITYKEAISLVGAANIDSILISVAGADGNYVG